MGKEAEIAAKFWKALRSDRTIMLGLAGAERRPRATDDRPSGR